MHREIYKSIWERVGAVVCLTIINRKEIQHINETCKRMKNFTVKSRVKYYREKM